MSFAAKVDAGTKRNMNVAAPKPTSMSAQKRSLKKVQSVIAMQMGLPSSKATPPGNRKKVVLQKMASAAAGLTMKPLPSDPLPPVPHSVTGVQRGPAPERKTSPLQIEKTLRKGASEPIIGGMMKMSVSDGPGGKRKSSKAVKAGGPAFEVEEEEVRVVSNEQDLFAISSGSVSRAHSESSADDEGEEIVEEHIETEGEKLFKKDFLGAQLNIKQETELWETSWLANGFAREVLPAWDAAMQKKLHDHTKELCHSHLSIASCMGPVGLRKWSMSFLSRRMHKELTATAGPL